MGKILNANISLLLLSHLQPSRPPMVADPGHGQTRKNNREIEKFISNGITLLVVHST